ncbi:hypothetical protein QJS10_CPB17g00022 [Acorus calamus]|uniref:Transcriptional coactivator Hfi1/Transcriptional adapter 1 n=1 Tax=Acorus calamus TaxID=4465 RepID=A0AAV9CXZ6_ACOCL|nr:hypothetical protein QJS10_CPB17g00022 [Acorus calamus]
MPPPPPQTEQQRIDVAELKTRIARKLGLERSSRYFSFLNRLLAQKLSKAEFDKLCLVTLGRENIFLHNQLIRSILRNAHHAKAPPPITHDCTVRKDGLQHLTVNQAPSIWSNGDLPTSPRKVRSVIRDRRLRDRPSPLGPNGKTDGSIMENGVLHPCDLQRPVQHLHGGPPAEQAEDELPPLKKPRLRQSPRDGEGADEFVDIEDAVEMEHDKKYGSARSPIRAPLGIPLCPVSVGAARRSLSASVAFGSGFPSSSESGELCHTEGLKHRMEQIARTEGLEGVSMDCANLLNIGLNVYLKRLIKSCIELVNARSGRETLKQSMQKQKVVNGVWPGKHLEGIGELRSRRPISLLDFKVAMELHPQQLGEDWPLLLEKICLCSFED